MLLNGMKFIFILNNKTKIRKNKMTDSAAPSMEDLLLKIPEGMRDQVKSMIEEMVK